MNLETKVGLFVLTGVAVLSLAIMKLSDIRLEKRYTLHFIFKDIQGLSDKSQVKVAGVEVGRVEKLELVDGRAKVTAKIKDEVPVYANARVRVQLIGLIGSQFLDLNPGTPEAPQLKDGDTINGEKGKSLNDLVEKLSNLIEGEPGKPGVGDDLRATMANLRNVSHALNVAIGMQTGELKDIVKNINQFTYDLKGLTKDMHEITSSKKEEIQQAVTKLNSILARVDDIVARVQRGEGAVGKLLADEEMGKEVKKTVSNLKEASESGKEVLNRFTKVRSYWEFQLRGAPQAETFRGDGGIRLSPRLGKYYYLGVSNAGDRKHEFEKANDYEKMNTITAVLGKEFGPVTVELGAIRSSAGAGVKYFPFQHWMPGVSTGSFLGMFELDAQVFEFGRDEVRGRAGRERRFKGPQYNLGAKVGINRFVKVGAQVEDLGEMAQYNLVTHVVFEDRDLAYLFGFVSFAR